MGKTKAKVCWHLEYGFPVEVLGTFETANGVALAVRSLDPRSPGDFESDWSELVAARRWAGDPWRDN